MSTHVRRLGLITIVVLTAISVLGPARLQATQPIPPAVSVVAFDGPGISQRDREAMADELAARLVDTRRFRVMPREWLPADRENPDPAMAALVDSAKAARIDYLIFGTVRQYASPTNSPHRPLLLTALMMTGRVAGPTAWLLPALAASNARMQSVISIHVRVMDVETADVVRTVNSSRSTRTAAPMLGSASAPTLNRDWTKAIAEIAGTLDVRRASAPDAEPRHR